MLKLPPGDPGLGQVRADAESYIAIEAVPSRIQYQWLDEFIREIDDPALRKRMEAAINGKGAFRRFKDILLTLPDERRRWFEFRDQMMRKRVVEWVHEIGIEPLNTPPWLGEDGQDQGLPSPPLEPVTSALNAPTDVDALRDFLIEWAEGVEASTALSPISLEKLAMNVAERFVIQTKR